METGEEWTMDSMLASVAAAAAACEAVERSSVIDGSSVRSSLEYDYPSDASSVSVELLLESYARP